MSTNIPDSRRLAHELALIVADMHRADHRVEEVLAIGSRLSRVGSAVARACELGYASLPDEVAA